MQREHDDQPREGVANECAYLVDKQQNFLHLRRPSQNQGDSAASEGKQPSGSRRMADCALPLQPYVFFDAAFGAK
jgi:hypothetical protein